MKDFIKILFFWKILTFDKNRDNEKIFKSFFPNFKSKVCSQDFSTNELEVDFTSDLVCVQIQSVSRPTFINKSAYNLKIRLLVRQTVKFNICRKKSFWNLRLSSKNCVQYVITLMLCFHRNYLNFPVVFAKQVSLAAMIRLCGVIWTVFFCGIRGLE